jgi:hypothetical protein
MNESNYVARTARGTYVVVVDGAFVGEFLDKEEAERTYNIYRGLASPSGVRPEDQYAPMYAPCGHGEPAPVVGGCWCCIGGYWATDPTYCQYPKCVECGNCPGHNVQPQPAPGTAPVSPESGPGMPGEPTPPAVQLVDQLAARLGTSRGGLATAGAIVAAAYFLR